MHEVRLPPKRKPGTALARAVLQPVKHVQNSETAFYNGFEEGRTGAAKAEDPQNSRKRTDAVARMRAAPAGGERPEASL